MYSKRSILLCLSLLVGFSAFGQEEATDKLLWGNVHITKELKNNFSARAKISYYSTMPLFSPRFIDLGTTYEPTEHLSFGLYYRFKGAFQTSCQRFYFESSYKKLKIESLGISLSARFRVQHRIQTNTENLDVRTYQMRPRLMIKKTVNKQFKAYSSIESFYSNQGVGTKFNYDRLRFDLGLSCKVPNTKHQVRVFYRYQADYEDKIDALSMINMSYRFNF